MMDIKITIYDSKGNQKRVIEEKFKDEYDVVSYACQLIKFGDVYNFEMKNNDNVVLSINAYKNKGFGDYIENGLFYLASRTEKYNDLWDRFYDTLRYSVI